MSLTRHGAARILPLALLTIGLVTLSLGIAVTAYGFTALGSSSSSSQSGTMSQTSQTYSTFSTPTQTYTFSQGYTISVSAQQSSQGCQGLTPPLPGYCAPPQPVYPLVTVDNLYVGIAPQTLQLSPSSAHTITCGYVGGDIPIQTAFNIPVGGGGITSVVCQYTVSIVGSSQSVGPLSSDPITTIVSGFILFMVGMILSIVGAVALRRR